jgi:hypothetical protein
VYPPDDEPGSPWAEQDAGPVVRPYALTGGRTRPSGERFDLLALVCAVRSTGPDLDLPLGVVRILISDLRERGLVTIHRAAPAGLADLNILKEVADGLRRI